MSINPIIKTDYPDPDVIRVGDTYYMISTTMHFFPGGAILRSYDLINWEVVNYVFNSLDDTPEEHLMHESVMYAGGMWAPTLRFYDGKYYAAFVSHYTQTTYLFIATDPLGAWEKRTIKGYYHDCSLLFDDDGRKYIVYGNSVIKIQELNDDLSGPKEGGLERIVAEEHPEGGLGYEGSHIYKINGKYYLFLIHWLKGQRRTECCFISESLEGEFKGYTVFDDDRGFCNMGVAQGGIVDTPNGKWYSVMFQDSGAVGRMPVLIPVRFGKDGVPVFGVNGRVPNHFEVASTRPYYRYEPPYTSDFFDNDIQDYGALHPSLKKQWQWNHQPDESLWYAANPKKLVIKTGKICTNLTHAVNTLTQRMMWPRCEAEVTVDGSKLNDGDVAGLCALQGAYAYLAISKEGGYFYLIKVVNNPTDEGFKVGTSGDFMPGEVVERIRLPEAKVTLLLKATFDKMTDRLDFFYIKDNKYVKIGTAHQLRFRLDHFVGARFGLFAYSTRSIGGSAAFSDFNYRYEEP